MRLALQQVVRAVLIRRREPSSAREELERRTRVLGDELDESALERGFDVVLVGDSHADAISTGVVTAATRLGYNVLTLTGAQCEFTRHPAPSEYLPNCAAMNNDLLDRATGINPPAVVVMSHWGAARTETEKNWPQALDPTITELRQAQVPVLIQLDHAGDRELIERAAAAGVDAVMADGSRLPYEQNLAFSAAVAQELRPRGIAVEAELGRVEGDEDVAAQTAGGALTDPAEAAAFLRSSGVDCLAVSIGNVHGHYAGAPVLDWERLKQLRGAGALGEVGALQEPRAPGDRRGAALRRRPQGAPQAAARRRRAAIAARGVRSGGRRREPGRVAWDRQGQRQHRAARGVLRRARPRRRSARGRA